MRLRNVGRALATLALVGSGAFGVASPAAAAEPVIEFSDSCGFVDFDATLPSEQTVTGTSVASAANVTVSRNGIVVVVSETTRNRIGVSDGDKITVQIDQFAPQEHTYAAPAGCDNAPKITFELVEGCQGLAVLQVDNAGEAVGGFTLGTGDEKEAADFAVGKQSVELFSFPGDVISVTSFDEESKQTITWLRRTYTEPKGCGKESLTAVFTDDCDSVKAELTSKIGGPSAVFLVKNPDDAENGELIELLFVSAGTPATHDIPAVEGDEIAYYYLLPEDLNAEQVEGLKSGIKGGKPTFSFGKSAAELPGLQLVASHVYKVPADCGGEGGGLPVTGFPVGLAAAGGALLLAVGAGLFLVARRRRVA